MSGGSSSLLSTPTWLALGFPLPTAVASDKLAGAFWTALGGRNYLRARSVDTRLLLGVALSGAAGALIGTKITIGVNPALLKRVVGGLIVTVVLLVAVRPRFGTAPAAPRLTRGAVTGLGFPLGIYEGLLGSGNSIMATLLFAGGRGLDLPTALGHYYVVAAVWCAIAAAAYAAQGVFDLHLAGPAVLGSIAGGYLGSRIGSLQGALFIRVLFILAGVILGGKLLLGY